MVNTLEAVRVGYLDSDNVAPVVGNDAFLRDPYGTCRLRLFFD